MALLVLAVAATLSSWNISRLEKTQGQISNANAVLNRLADFLEAFGDSVIASRGSAPDAVQLLSHAVESMQLTLRDVRQGTIDNQDQQQRIRLLEDSLNQVIALERRRLESAKRKGVNAGNAALAEGGGRELFDRLGE